MKIKDLLIEVEKHEIQELERQLRWKEQKIKHLEEFIQKGRERLKEQFNSIVSLSAEVVALDDKCQILENKIRRIDFEARADERNKFLPRWYIDPIWFFGLLAITTLMIIYNISGFFKKKKNGKTLINEEVEEEEVTEK